MRVFLFVLSPWRYLSRESIIWVCTTSFIHTCIYHMFNLFTICLYVPCFSYCFLCIFSVLDSSIYMIYYRSFNFPYITYHFLYLGPHHLIIYTCACYARHLTLLYVLVALSLITLDSHVQILETGPWWPCCSWSEYAADPSMTIGVQQKLGCCRSSSSQFLSCLAPEALLLLVNTSQLLYIFHVFYFWWCNIPIILCHSLRWPCICTSLL